MPTDHTWDPRRTRPGVYARPDGAGFGVSLFAPQAQHATLHVEGRDPLALEPAAEGYWVLAKAPLEAGDRYTFSVDGAEPHPDPASLAQPGGVHAASAVVDLASNSPARWSGRALDDMVLYELHVGTFSREGTFDGAVAHLDALVELGVNALELMPLNSFPGCRNWGYDGVYWQAVQQSYGGPAGLRRLVSAAHARGLAVIIDTVFNHFGPEGNYVGAFGPYLSAHKGTPWGPALNTDGADSDGVRDLVLSVAHTWLVDYGADGLRLDAVHAIPDTAARHLLEELSDEVAGWSQTLGRPLTLIAECDLNDPRYIRPVAQGGLGMSAQWVDEYHHALRAYLTGERRGYYGDFGSLDDIERGLRTAYVYTGQYSAHRRRRFGRVPSDAATHQFVVFGQNHDQVGNRARGERLIEHLDPTDYQLLAAMVLWSPFTPMLWMGEEYAERRPFPFFVDHGDIAVLQGTREGRSREFEAFLPPGEHVPDPGDPGTFASAILTHERRGATYEFYREALRLRSTYWPTRRRALDAHSVERLGEDTLVWRMPRLDGSTLEVVANLGERPFDLTPLGGATAESAGRVLLGSSAGRLGGALPARTAGLWLLETPDASIEP